MINDTGLRVGPSKPAEHDLRKAWIAVALLPVAFVVAMFVGEGLISALGYDSGESVPVGPALLASIPALLVLIAPGVAAVFYGNRAHPRRRPDGRHRGRLDRRDSGNPGGRRQRLGVPGRGLRR
jgi:hypothetical protein